MAKPLGKKLVNLARNLRKQQTDAENLLWRHLRNKQQMGLKFRRQQPIGNFIVDFVCLDQRLIIELDGDQHGFPLEKNQDQERDNWLQKECFRVLRFWNNEVLQNLEGVIDIIIENIILKKAT